MPTLYVAELGAMVRLVGRSIVATLDEDLLDTRTLPAGHKLIPPCKVPKHIERIRNSAAFKEMEAHLGKPAPKKGLPAAPPGTPCERHRRVLVDVETHRLEVVVLVGRVHISGPPWPTAWSTA